MSFCSKLLVPIASVAFAVGCEDNALAPVDDDPASLDRHAPMRYQATVSMAVDFEVTGSVVHEGTGRCEGMDIRADFNCTRGACVFQLQGLMTM